MKRTVLFTICITFLAVSYIFSQDTIILQPGPEGKDAMIMSLTPDTNRGNTEVFRSMAWTHSGVPGNHRGLIEFDLSSIPVEAIVLSAKLDLIYASFDGNGVTNTGDNESYLLRITEGWQETKVTWNNQPSTTMENAVILPRSTSPEQDYTGIDITPLVQMMVSDPENNHGLMLQLVTEEYYRCMLFASGDCLNPGKRPKLEIIYLPCAPPPVSFDYQADGFNINFTGTAPSAINWHWDFGDGYYSNLPNPWHNYEQSGTYEVCLTVSDSCSNNTHCEMITVCEPLLSGFTFSFLDLTAYFENQSLAADNYFWDFGDGYFSYLSNPVHTYNSAQNHTVCLISTNACDSDTICHMLDPSLVGHEIENPEWINIYPNPARNEVFIKSNNPGPCELVISDLSGKEIRRLHLNITGQEPVKARLGNITPGIYILKLIQGRDYFYSKLIISR